MLNRILVYCERKKRISKNNKLIKKGVLVVGNNTDIGNLEINFATETSPGKINIKIGNDCIINAKIVIYNKAATVNIGNRVFIGPKTEFFCNDNITLEDDILLSWGITVIDTNAHSLLFEDRKLDVINWNKGIKIWKNIKSAPVLIKSKSWIGFNSIITKGVVIGEEAIVSCGSVVVKDVQRNSIVGGNPSVIISTNEN